MLLGNFHPRVLAQGRYETEWAYLWYNLEESPHELRLTALESPNFRGNLP